MNKSYCFYPYFAIFVYLSFAVVLIIWFTATGVTIHHKQNSSGGISGLICVWAHVILFALLFWIVEPDNRA